MIPDDPIISFPLALTGFPALTEFRLFEPAGAYPLKFLQSTTAPEVSFACMDAASVKLDYEVPLSPEDAAALALLAPEEAMVLTLVVVPKENPRRMTANLAGPLVVNTRTLQGRQIALDSRVFPLQYPVFPPQVEGVITFPSGIIGFPELQAFQLLEPADAYPLKFLKPIGREDIHFVCIDIAAIKNDYQVALSDEDAKALAIETITDAMVLALVVVPQDPRQMTANLAGPILINLKTRQGRQIVLNIEQFPLKYPVFSDK
jgi:flagellar assembly factor FliW